MRHLLIALLGAVLLLSGCATTTKTETRRVYAEPTAPVAVGNQVLVRTKDGRRLEFEVTAVDDQSVQGKGVSVARSDISSVKVATTRTTTTTESSAAPAVQAVSTLAIVYGVICVVALILIF